MDGNIECVNKKDNKYEQKIEEIKIKNWRNREEGEKEDRWWEREIEWKIKKRARVKRKENWEREGETEKTIDEE